MKGITESAPALWGAEFNTIKKWMDRQDNDFKAHMAEITTEIEYARCELVDKGFTQVMVMLQAYHESEDLIPDSGSFAGIL